MKVALVAPLAQDCESNQGCHMITAGIRWLVWQADPDAMFVGVEMLRDVPRQWEAAKSCDVAILCGNPRLTLSDDAWWEDGILDRMLELKAAGVRIIDGWAGACVAPDRLDGAVDALLSTERNRRNLDRLRQFDGVIARDDLTLRTCNAAGVRVVALPCSSWWAADHHTVDACWRKSESLAVVGDPAVAGLAVELGFDVIATSVGDYEAVRAAGIAVDLIADPVSLLQVYGRAAQVLSSRIHAAIPAARMGAEVCVLAIDSRVQAVAPFGLPVLPQEDFVSGAEPVFAPARPNLGHAVDVVKGILQ